ncbi:hypothetical protein [Synechocystis sp. LKSZ1]|uniref:hypothetical protein n=1 Tax=Synechocystis sp. LKSZ1 TaxID=3144951 RepID=UPI00336BFA54
MRIHSFVKIFCLLTIVLTPVMALAETPVNPSSAPVSPKPLVLKPNATEGYTQKMRKPPPMAMDISQKQ